MDIEIDENGNTVIKTSDLSELIGYLKSRDKREIEAFRPVLVITIDDPIRNDGVQRRGVDFGQSLVESIALAGYSAGDAAYTDIASDLYSFDFPNDISFASMPVQLEPEVAYSHHSLRQLDTSGKHAAAQKRVIGVHVAEEGTYQQLLRDNVKVLVIAAHELTDSYIVKTLDHWNDIATNDLPTVIHHGPSGGGIVSGERIDAARIRFQAEKRFLFNHAINFSELAKRALFKIYHDDQVTKQVAAKALPYISQYSWRWAHPFFLQLLHFLKRNGRIGTHEDRINLARKVHPFSYAHVYAKGLPVFESKGSGYEFVWNGTGAYPEYRIDVGRAPEPHEYDPDAYSSHFPHWMFTTFQHVEHTGLLGLERGNIVLSPWGLKFLEIMGPETDDADVLVKWRTDGGELGGIEDIAEMDNWNARAFSSAKRRIESFQNELTFFDDATYFKSPHSNQLSVYGVHLPIDDADLSDAEFAEQVALIGEAEGRIPLADRNSGLVREPERMGAESKVIGVWIGVPLAVSRLDEMRQEPGWLKDLDTVRDEAIAALDLVSPLIRKRIEKQPIGIVHGLPVVEKVGVARELKWRMEADDQDVIRPIFLGVTSVIDKSADHSKALSIGVRISSGSSTLPAPDYYDAINTYHGKGTSFVATVCGYFVGLYNETKDTFVIDRELNQQRVEDFESRKEFLLGNIAPYFAVDRSPHGYWAILADGTAKRMNLSLQS